jgi:hypothetical protein
MEAAQGNNRAVWRRGTRDVGILLALLILTWSLFAQADARRPTFSMTDIHVITGTIASFESVAVPERAAAPNINSTTYRARTALRIQGYPPNLLAYVPGSSWNMDADVAPGTIVRLEVTEEPGALAARARANPTATYPLAIDGLQIGGRVHFTASDSITRAENAALVFTRLALAAALASLLWLGWLVWSYRHVAHPIRNV